MQEFLEWLAVPMERPKSYGTFHLTFMIVGLIIVIVAAFLLRKLNEKQNRIFLGIVGGILTISEIIKILFNTFIINGGNFAWWVFPFQLCSIPMYLCLICAFVKNEKFNSYLYEFMFGISLLTAFLTLAEPSGLHKDYIFLTWHSYIWHLTLIFIGLYLYFSKRACINKYGFLKAMAVFGVVATIAFILNLSIKQPGFNAFYMSPYVPSQIVVFDKIWLSAGWFVSNLAYVVAILAACAGVYYLAYLFRCQRKKKLQQVNVGNN